MVVVRRELALRKLQPDETVIGTVGDGAVSLPMAAESSFTWYSISAVRRNPATSRLLFVGRYAADQLLAPVARRIGELLRLVFLRCGRCGGKDYESSSARSIDDPREAERGKLPFPASARRLRIVSPISGFASRCHASRPETTNNTLSDNERRLHLQEIYSKISCSGCNHSDSMGTQAAYRAACHGLNFESYHFSVRPGVRCLGPA